MAEKEIRIILNIATAMAVVPDEKKEFFIGFAEGAAAMATALGKGKLDGYSEAMKERERADPQKAVPA